MAEQEIEFVTVAAREVSSKYDTVIEKLAEQEPDTAYVLRGESGKDFAKKLREFQHAARRAGYTARIVRDSQTDDGTDASVQVVLRDLIERKTKGADTTEVSAAEASE